MDYIQADDWRKTAFDESNVKQSDESIAESK